MFRDRIFNISFLISLAGHVFCIFFVILIITPSGFSFNKFPTIDFLGPILEQDISASYDLKPTLMATPYKEDFVSDKDIFWKNYNYLDARALADSSLDQIQFKEPKMQKQTPDFINTFLKMDEGLVFNETKKLQSFEDIKLGEPLVARAIVYRPTKPVLPKWAKESNMNFSISLKLFVSNNGVVQSVNRLTTTGYQEIDLMAMKYASGFIFQPLYGSGASVIQEGQVDIILN